MERFSIEEAYFLVPGPLVPWNHHKARWEIGEVRHALSRGGPARQDLQTGLHVHRHKWSHVEDVVILEEQEVVGVIEALDAVHIMLQKLPLPVKLVDGKIGEAPDAWLERDTHKALWEHRVQRSHDHARTHRAYPIT